MGLRRKSNKPNRRKSKLAEDADPAYHMHSPSLADDGMRWQISKFSIKDSPEVRRAILDALLVGHTLSGAAVKAGVDPKTMRKWRDDDPVFAQQIAEAIEVGNDFIEEEVRRRAVQGTDKPVFQGGVLVGVVREYSDKLTEFLMTARKPERFGKQRLEHGGIDGQPIKYETEVTFVAPKASE